MKTQTKVILTVSSLAAFYLYFNRNPNREIGQGIVSPSDGTITSIENNKITIFIGLTDVHFQRAPTDGIVTQIHNNPDKTNVIHLNTNYGEIIIKRWSGTLAKTVITNIKVGDYVKKGDIIGRILLGSHTSIYPIYNPTVNIGDHILAGQTISL